jgi:hypothetical protein
LFSDDANPTWIVQDRPTLSLDRTDGARRARSLPQRTVTDAGQMVASVSGTNTIRRRLRRIIATPTKQVSPVSTSS